MSSGRFRANAGEIKQEGNGFGSGVEEYAMHPHKRAAGTQDELEASNMAATGRREDGAKLSAHRSRELTPVAISSNILRPMHAQFESWKVDNGFWAQKNRQLLQPAGNPKSYFIIDQGPANYDSFVHNGCRGEVN